MRLKVLLTAAAFVALFAVANAPAYADDRPDEGRITRVVPDAQLITVQVEDGDQMDFQWNETTKLDGKATLGQLKAGDYIHFEYVEREGVKFLTEIKRTSRAKD